MLTTKLMYTLGITDINQSYSLIHDHVTFSPGTGDVRT